MALSNWDMLAIDGDGKACMTKMVAPNGVTVEIYKNWVYVHDPAAAAAGNKGFTGDTVMSIWHGEVSYKGVDLYVERVDDQDAVFVATGYRDYDNPENNRSMFGIGCYGFAAEEYVGVLPETCATFVNWLTTLGKTETIGFVVPETFDLRRYNAGDAYFYNNLVDPDASAVDSVGTVCGEQAETMLSRALQHD